MLRHLRAAAVLFHLVAITLMALPSPPKNMNQLKSEQGKAQLASWAGVARAVGFDVSDEDFGLWIRATAGAWRDGRDVVIKPISPYFQYTGTRQAWRMFSVVSRRPTALEIQALKAGAWETVHVTGAAGPWWRETQLEQERVRAFLSGFASLSRRSEYRQFVHRWAAPTLFADDPEVESVRVQLRRGRSLDPARARAGEAPAEKLRWVETVDREAP